MSNLKDARKKKAIIKLSDGVEREVKFTLNVMADLEDEYGSVDAAFAALNDGKIKTLRHFIWAGLSSGEEPLTELQIGNLIDMSELQEILSPLNSALGDDLPEPAEVIASAQDGEVKDPN